MIWLICAIISLILIALSVKFALTKSKGSFRFLWVLIFLFVATYVAYLPGYLYSYSISTAIFGNIVNTLQVITIDADYFQLYEVVHQAIPLDILASLYMVMLVIFHILMPIVSALSAATLLLRCFSKIKLYFANRSKKPTYVFSELNERSLKLAKDLSKTKCNIIFANCDDDSILSKGDDTKNFIYKDESIEELKLTCKNNKQVYFFLLSENEDESLASTLAIIETYSKVTESLQENIHIYHFSKNKDYSIYIDSTNKGSLDIRCINEYEMLIYNLLDKFPLYKYAKNDIHVLLYGLSKINQTALKTIVWCGQVYNHKLKISVVGKDIENQVDELKIAVPGFFEGLHNINFYNTKTETESLTLVKEKCKDASYVIVSENTDNETMEKGVELRRLFYKVDETFTNCPPIFCYIKDEAKSNVLANLKTAENKEARKMSYSLVPFGNIEEIYTMKYLVDSSLEKIAKNVHLAYEEIFSDGPIDVKEAIKRYNIFEVNKRSNRANALHIRYKLNLLGLDYTEDENATSVDFKKYLTEELLDKLAYSEHDRWLSFLQSEGWTTSSKADVYAYKESGISKGRHNCPILKLHPYICEFEKLKDLSLEIEGKDTTVYDSELIIRIPDILGDKWGVAKTNFKIIKM